ncbi:hypothetical protein MTR67_003643 [Solanum verrucosum]|uniref:F-box associated beta-propeller type 1 domain-containing protein n=1 Tax=Solanum verrucosum TaxID=315347 RepID=A0AAF0PSJ8_SOLVR|nr:hypothetical protein MTR67_003643 [Solanum verrucosum]
MVVVWISLPRLLPDLFAKRSLLSRASAVGKPIAIDKATQDKTRPSTARVKVILDLMGPAVGQHLAEFLAEFWGSFLTRTTDLQDRPWVLLWSVDGARECHLQHQKSAIWSIFGYEVVHVVNLEYDQASDPKIPAAGVLSGKDPSLAMIEDPSQANKVLKKSHEPEDVVSRLSPTTTYDIDLGNDMFDEDDDDDMIDILFEKFQQQQDPINPKRSDELSVAASTTVSPITTISNTTASPNTATITRIASPIIAATTTTDVISEAVVLFVVVFGEAVVFVDVVFGEAVVVVVVVIGEAIVLEAYLVHKHKQSSYREYGFGYDFASDDYKVVNLSRYRKGNIDTTFVDVYSVRMGLWRRLESLPYDDVLSERGGASGVFVNGVLHWMAKSEIDAWVMKEYRVEESWTTFSIDRMDLENGLVPFCPISDDDVVLSVDRDRLTVYNIKEDQWRYMEVDRLTYMFERTGIFFESLVSPMFGKGTEGYHIA